jgi:hypothetical protein
LICGHFIIQRIVFLNQPQSLVHCTNLISLFFT